ncbi:MAG: hypothetical protein KBD24_01550 [Candidatus Pacebacteria bacterium]|nr:hypothetical protein [Candidatus Paceibacterota bacterium]
MVKQAIVPAIIPVSYAYLEDRLREVRGAVRSVQVDVMDGTYAPTSSWPYIGVEKEAFESLRREDQGLPYWQEFDFEVDLLVRNPEAHINEWALAGITRVIVHVESTDKLAEAVALCQERRLEVALALKPSTDIAMLAPYVDEAVFVQCMGNDRIGYQGVSLDSSVPDKIREIKTRWPDLLVAVDIGVSKETIPALYTAGARRFVAGSAVFGTGEPKYAIEKLHAIVAECARG